MASSSLNRHSWLTGRMGEGVSLSLSRYGYPVVNHCVVSGPFSREHGFSGGNSLPDLCAGACSHKWTDEAVGFDKSLIEELCSFPKGAAEVDPRNASSHRNVPSPRKGHDLHISGQQVPGFIKSGEPAQSRNGKLPRSWPYIQKSDLLGSVSRGPFKKTKVEVAVILVVHVGSGGTDFGLRSLRGFHKNPLDGISISSTGWTFLVAAAVPLTREPTDRFDTIDPGVTMNEMSEKSDPDPGGRDDLCSGPRDGDWTSPTKKAPSGLTFHDARRSVSAVWWVFGDGRGVWVWPMPLPFPVPPFQTLHLLVPPVLLGSSPTCPVMFRSESKKESYRAPFFAAAAGVPNVARKSNSADANLGGWSSPSDYKSRLPSGFQEGRVPLGMKGSPMPPENSFILLMGLRVPAIMCDRSCKGFVKSWNVLEAITTDLQGYDLPWSQPASGAKVRCPSCLRPRPWVRYTGLHRDPLWIILWFIVWAGFWGW